MGAGVTPRHAKRQPIFPQAPTLHLMAWMHQGEWMWQLKAWGELVSSSYGGTGFDFSYCPIATTKKGVW